MATGEVVENRLPACCLSHLFHTAAAKFPNKLAVIQATGFAGIARDSHRNNVEDTFKINTPETASSSLPPIYTGDECFTLAEILLAVNNLSSRLRRILDGADDEYMIKPSPVNIIPSEKSEHIYGPLQHSKQSTSSGNVHTPKVVAIYMEPSVEYIVAVFSVLRCGEAFMPLDPAWPKARILSVISSSGAQIVIGCNSSNEGISCHRLDALQWLISDGSAVLPISMKEIMKDNFQPLLMAWPCESENIRSFCYLMYTSGSSGKPKGVCGTEIGLLNRYLWMQELYPLHDRDLVLFKTPISFVDHLQEFLGAILSTCTLVIPPFNQLKENIYYVIDFLQGYSISRFVAVPSLMTAIVPALQCPRSLMIQFSLKLLVLSGETLHISLCKTLQNLLPKTSILNLYGSTEVTGDCTYFDCKRLPKVPGNEVLGSVPIGLPIPNCDVMLVGEDAPHYGEIVVGGLCLAAGYFQYPYLMPLIHVDLPPPISSINGRRQQHYFRTGDFARKLPSGDLIFLGRKDRTVKLNGQRVALEEIESSLLDHPVVVDAAVICHEVEHISTLAAHLVTEKSDQDAEILRPSLRIWLQNKLPQFMIPTRFYFTKSLPLTSSGKVDYVSLANSTYSDGQIWDDIENIPEDNLIQVVKQVFSDALMVDKVSDDDNFFEMGGSSISAAYVAFKLGVHMQLIYTFPTPQRLQMALSSSSSSLSTDSIVGVNLRKLEGGMIRPMDSRINNFHGSKLRRRLLGSDSSRDIYNPAKQLKLESNMLADSKKESLSYISWNPTALHTKCSFARCNKGMHGGQCAENYLLNSLWSNKIPRERKGYMQELWRVNLSSCVDASPLVISKGSDVYLFIGSHSHNFVCIDAISGAVHWQTKLEGRIECSAAILDDFSQVVVGCYQGYIYFLDFQDGSVCWSFKTHGEVKSQPVVDKCRHLVWCGSYDHNLYAINYKSYCCIYKFPCGGSIYGSPVIDEVKERLFVASTSGHVTALSIKAMPCEKLWKQDLGAPIFGSLSISNGNIICCLVDGTVIVLSTCGSILWKARTDGPIFAGPCTSGALPSQVLVCSRDGSTYSFEMETGILLWKHVIGNPITSSPYVDENSHLVSNISSLSERLLCVCDSSGIIYVFIVDSNAIECASKNMTPVVQEFARFDLTGDIFSSPVMIGGRIFVGCRDDHLYCIKIDVE